MTFSTLASPGVSLQGGGGSGGGGTPGGSDTQIQYNSSGTFAGASGLTTNGTELTIASGTVTTSSPVIDAAQTWNDGAVTFTGLKFNATDTDSAAASLLMDLQVNTSSKVAFGKNGSLALNGGPLNTGELNTPTSGGLRFGSAIHGLFPNGSNEVHLICAGTTAAFFRNSATFAVFNNSMGLSNASSTADVILSRRAAANLRLGAADTTGTTAPTPQFLSAQSWASSTTDNQTGADFTIDGSQGTGTGAGGSIIFRVAPAGGTSNGVQNALATALTIASTTDVTFAANAVITGKFFYNADITGNDYFFGSNFYARTAVRLASGVPLGWSSSAISPNAAADLILARDAANTLALRNGANAQESRVYGSYTATDNYQRMSIKTLRESSGALSGASYTTTIAIPAYANLIGVTTRVTTAVTGATTYDVGDGSDVDIWGAAIGIALGSQSRTADFTAVAAVGAAATSRTVTLTANGSNFTGGVVEICLHYLTTEAD